LTGGAFHPASWFDDDDLRTRERTTTPHKLSHTCIIRVSDFDPMRFKRS
jgi:hypothetical protein